MKTTNKMSKIAILVECALMIGIATVLSLISVQIFPFGGSTTAFSTLPIVLASIRHGGKWGLGTAIIYGLVQMFMGFQFVVTVPVPTVFYMILCALLDYVLAYALLGLAGPISNKLGGSTKAIAASIAITGSLRFLCSFISGLLIWNQWQMYGWPVWLHSLVYNLTWCAPDVIIVIIAVVLLARVKVLGLVKNKNIQ